MSNESNEVGFVYVLNDNEPKNIACFREEMKKDANLNEYSEVRLEFAFMVDGMLYGFRYKQMELTEANLWLVVDSFLDKMKTYDQNGLKLVKSIVSMFLTKRGEANE